MKWPGWRRRERELAAHDDEQQRQLREVDRRLEQIEQQIRAARAIAQRRQRRAG